MPRTCVSTGVWISQDRRSHTPCLCVPVTGRLELVLSFHPVDPRRSNSGRQAQQPAPSPAESSPRPVHNLSEGDSSHSGNQGNSCQVGACEIKRLRHNKGNNGAKRQLPERASLDGQIADRGKHPDSTKSSKNCTTGQTTQSINGLVDTCQGQ